MKLTNPTNAELNAAFGQAVCRWTGPMDNGQWIANESNSWTGLPDFCSDANAVLPWLEKQHGWNIFREPSTRTGKLQWVVSCSLLVAIGIDEYMPKAAVIALLRAHGVEVEMT